MGHKDSGWRPHLGMETYKGYEVWDHEVGPHEINDGECDCGIEFDRDEDGNVLFEDE